MFPDLYVSEDQKVQISDIWPLFFGHQVPLKSVEMALMKPSMEERIRGVLKVFWESQSHWKGSLGEGVEIPDPETAVMFVKRSFDAQELKNELKTLEDKKRREVVAYFVHCTFTEDIEGKERDAIKAIGLLGPRDISFNKLLAPTKTRLVFGPEACGSNVKVSGHRQDGNSVLYLKYLTIGSGLDVSSGATFCVATQIMLLVHDSKVETLRWNDGIHGPLLFLEEGSVVTNMPSHVKVCPLSRDAIKFVQ